VNEQQLLAMFELLKHHYPYVLDFICANVPSAKTLLAGPSAAEEKLRKLQALEGQED
jgi:hypothetical protein